MRPQIQRMTGVRTVVDEAADLVAAAHDEAAQGPVAASDRKRARAILLQVHEAADDPLEVELSSPPALRILAGIRQSQRWWSDTVPRCRQSHEEQQQPREC